MSIILNFVELIAWCLLSISAIVFIAYLWIAFDFYAKEILNSFIDSRSEINETARKKGEAIIRLSEKIFLVLGFIFCVIGYVQSNFWFYICSSLILIVVPIITVIFFVEILGRWEAKLYARKVELEYKEAKAKQEKVSEEFRKNRRN